MIKIPPLADRLPPPALEKLDRFVQTEQEIGSIYQGLNGPIDHETDELATAERFLARFEAEFEAGRVTKLAESPESRRTEPDTKRLEAERAKVAAIRKRRDGLRRRQADVGARMRPWLATNQKLEKFILSVPGDVAINPHAEPIEIPEAASLDGVRGQLAALGQELKQTRRAPLPSSEVKQNIAARLEALAESGKPDLFMAIETGAEIDWPKENIQIVGNAATGGATVSRGNIFDALGLLAWLHKDDLLAKLNAEIDEIGDDEHALSRDERAAREAELTDEILKVGRIEEAVIEQMEASGVEVPRRADADPRAILNLSGDLPPPKK